MQSFVINYCVPIDEKIKQLNKEIDSIKVSDIDDRLSKIQDLIKFAKS